MGLPGFSKSCNEEIKCSIKMSRICIATFATFHKLRKEEYTYISKHIFNDYAFVLIKCWALINVSSVVLK